MLSQITLITGYFLFILSTSTFVFAGSKYLNLQIAIFGDAGINLPIVNAHQDYLLKRGINQIALLGDNAYPQTTSKGKAAQSYGNIWGPWRQAGFKFPLVTLGNHFYSIEQEMDYFGLQSTYYSQYIEKFARFIVLDSEQESLADAQAIWLEGQLENSSEPLNFILLHHPPVTLSGRHSWEEKLKFQNLIRPVLQRYSQKVTAVFAGHDHMAALYQWGNLPLVVSGAFWETFPANSVNNSQAGYLVRSLWRYRAEPHLVRLQAFTNERGIETWVHFVSVIQQRTVCSVRLFPKPFFFEKTCSMVF